MKLNYQKKLEETLQKLQAEGKRPVLVLHCCCAPCSTYVLKYLAQYFIIKILFYNPNITADWMSYILCSSKCSWSKRLKS